MLILAHHHNATTGRCFPSYERIAEEANLAKSSVARAIKELCEAGLIEKRKGRRAGSQNAPNFYDLRFLTHEALVSEKVRHAGYDRDGRAALPKQESPTSPLRSEVGSAPKRKRSQKRAPKRRLEPDWRPSAALLKAASEAGFEDHEVERMILDFRDYYIARGEISAVWGLDWSRWVRRQKDLKEKQREQDERRAASNGSGGRRPSTGDSIASFYASVVGGSGDGD